MELKCLSMFDMGKIRWWRSRQMQMLRTSFPLTQEMQEDFYENVICNRNSNSRFWGLWNKDKIIGMCGIENIQWENRFGEISLLLNHGMITDENLQKSLKLILHEGFNKLNLENIFTEVYECSHMHMLWIESANKHNAKLVVLPNRKYWNGKYYDSEYINFNKERYNESIITESS